MRRNLTVSVQQRQRHASESEAGEGSFNDSPRAARGRLEVRGTALSDREEEDDLELQQVRAALILGFQSFVTEDKEGESDDCVICLQTFESGSLVRASTDCPRICNASAAAFVYCAHEQSDPRWRSRRPAYLASQVRALPCGHIFHADCPDPRCAVLSPDKQHSRRDVWAIEAKRMGLVVSGKAGSCPPQQ